MSDDEIKKPESAEAEMPQMVIHTIPMEFYGGKNPAADYPVASPVAVTVSPSKQTPAPPIPATPKLGTAIGGTAQPLAAGKPKWILPAIIGGVLIVVLGGGTVAYFAFQAKPAEPEPSPPVIAVTAPEEIKSEIDLQPPKPEPTPVVLPKPLSLIAPHTFTDSLDGDADGLTDVEEELWGTNPTVADSDGDTYSDGVELRNLYNPIGTAPQRLIDAGLVSTYVNTEYKYTAMYPKAWLPQDVDAGKTETIFTSVNGEFVAINVLKFPTTVPFAEWFAQQFPDEAISNYSSFTNRMKVAGIISADKTVAIITDGAQVFLLRYDGGSRSQINYRTSFESLVQSFKPASVATPIEFLPKTVVAPEPAEEIIPLPALLQDEIAAPPPPPPAQ